MGSNLSHYPRVLRRPVPVTSLTIQLTITPIMAWTFLEGFDTLLFTFFNDDTTNIYTVVVETGEDGAAVDGERVYTLDVPVKSGSTPGQRTLEIPGNIRGWWRASGTATGSAVAARFMLKAIPRLM